MSVTIDYNHIANKLVKYMYKLLLGTAKCLGVAGTHITIKSGGALINESKYIHSTKRKSSSKIKRR